MKENHYLVAEYTYSHCSNYPTFKKNPSFPLFGKASQKASEINEKTAFNSLVKQNFKLLL